MSAFAGAEKQEGPAAARASDTEPANDNPNNAEVMSSGEVVVGSIKTNPGTDLLDWYKVSVPYLKVLNVSMYQIDYDVSNPGRINLQLGIFYNAGGTLQTIAMPWTMNRWESCNFFQVYSTQAPMDIWILVVQNQTNDNPPVSKTDPGSYTVSMSITDPIAFTGSASGDIDRKNSPSSGRYYIMNPGPADNKHAYVRLACPTWGDYDLYVYNIWTRDGQFWMQNASWVNMSASVEEVRVGGSEGTYYIFVDGFDGAGTYQLTADMTQGSMDDDNVPSKATLITDNYPHQTFMDQGADGVDWFKVNMKAGKPLSEVYFTINGAHGSNLYNMSLFDKDFKYLKGMWSTQSGAWPDFSQQSPNPLVTTMSIKNVPATYDGPLYVAIKAERHFYAQGENTFIGARCWYKMTFTLPNDVPLASPIPEIHVTEDTKYDLLLLSDYFSDPDGNSLNYTIIGSGFHSRPTVDSATGLVTFNPEPNWTGMEKVQFQATDDGAGNKFNRSFANVYVDPVNDYPFVAQGITNIVLSEEQEGVTPDLSSVFNDVDDPFSNFSFNYKIVTSDTKPAGATLPMQYDLTNKVYKIGPALQFYGTFNLQITCTDGHQGTVPVSTSFQITINHKNHSPALKEAVQDPIEMTVKEDQKDSHYNVADLFEDIDTVYAGDNLTYAVTGQVKLTVSVNMDGYIVFDTGKEEYWPGVTYEEKVKVTAKDKAGKAQTLNFTVSIEPVNDMPAILTFQPSNLDLTKREGETETFRITASDVDTQKLTYTWYVDGKKDKTASGQSYPFTPDYTMGGAIHAIKVEVFDGTTTVNKEWNVTVTDVNRLPSAMIKLPTNSTRFKKGTMITFTGEASDPDSDALTFIWLDGQKKEIGRGPSIQYNKLPKGTQTITLDVNDSKGSTLQTVTIAVTVDTPPSATPGFEGIAAMGVIGFTLLVAAARRRRL